MFDLLEYLVRHRARVVDKDELLAKVWRGRIVSDSTLSSRLTAVRQAVRDSGAKQRLIRTLARKGFRFVGAVHEQVPTVDEIRVVAAANPNEGRSPTAIDGATSAERRQVTVMVCGLADTTALCTGIDPEELRDLVNNYCREVAKLVERDGGYIASRTHEGVVGYFGYPEAHEDDAERAVRAGLAAVRVAIDSPGAGIEGPVRGRVGIATGLVIVGSSDGDPAAKHTVSGEMPYTAAMLQGRGEPGQVIIASGTREIVRKLFDYRDLQTSPGASAASLVVGEGRIASRFEALRSTRNRLIGRDDERDLLLKRWAQAKAGEGRVVLVWGEPGIGKSRLVAAFEDAIKGEPHVSMRYFCSPHRMQTALHPVIAQLEHAAAFEDDDDDRTRLGKLERLLALSSGDPERDGALLAELLAIRMNARDSPLSLSAQRRKELLLESFLAQLENLALRQPVLMVLEDAHWIDPTTRELFDLVIDRIRGLAALLVMTYRPEFVSPWVGQAHVTVLTLNRLGRRENAALVKQVAGGKDLPPSLLERIIARTDGVPLFVEEVTKALLESGMLRETSAAYVFEGKLPAVAVPSSLQASLVARLDRIVSARTVVRISAALGREFRYDVLRAVTALPDSELATSLDQLVTSELVRRRGEVPHAAYTFKHALVQDAAYQTIPKSERPAIHGRIVEVLERQFPDIAEHHPDVMAVSLHRGAARRKGNRLPDPRRSYRTASIRGRRDAKPGRDGHEPAPQNRGWRFT